MRTLVALSCAVIGIGIGAVFGVLTGAPPGLGSWAGLLVGLAGGIWLARSTIPKRQRR